MITIPIPLIVVLILLIIQIGYKKNFKKRAR